MVARHQRAIGKGVKVLDLDHYLEILLRKPGALPGATALAQARAAKVFTADHDRFWAAARRAHGDAAGTRALVEVLLLHRRLAHADVLAGITAALAVGSINPDVVALEARKAGEHRSAPTSAETASTARRWSSPDLTPRRAAHRHPAAALHGQIRRPARKGNLMTARHTLTEPAATAAIDQGCRMLRLPTIRDRFSRDRRHREREHQTYLGFLAELVIAECDDRDHRRAERRIRDAAFPRPKRLEDFSFDANPAINPALIGQLASCDWVKAGHTPCV